ncbi:hypothetical protein A4X13_0g5730, partial [Tilletia indica]
MSGLDLFQQCPPGLGGTNCTQATCQSPYVDPGKRTLKPNTDQTCSSCDQGFSGINCNICSGKNSCQAIKSQLSPSNASPDTMAAAFGINQTLTCFPQPEVITQSFSDCEVKQATISAVFPGNLRLSLIRVAEPENSTATGQPSWSSQAGTTLSSVWLDGVEQFYCQAKGCTGQNQTQAISSVASETKWGTYNWTCSSLQCYCIPGTTMCNDNGPFPLSSLIASITGSLSLPCDYADPSNETATHACAFKGEILQNFLGDAGLPLQNCRSGSCMAQGTLDNFWANEVATAGAAGDKSSDSAQLTGGVIAGLVVLGLVVLGLLSLIGVGLLFRRRAARKPRAPPTGPVGLRWTNLSYTLPRPGKVGSALNQISTARHRNNASAFAADKEAHVMDDLGNGEPTYFNDTPDCLLQSVSGFAAPGKMVAILGPSGADKTTLIDLLAGRAKSGTQGGQVAYLYMNDSALDSQSTPASQSKLIAYVDQEDQLPALATVREALEFAATLSHTENVPSHERAQLVNRVLDALGLT